MIDFVSTRGGDPVGFVDALVRGAAPDGGLYVPQRVGSLEPPGPLPVDGFANDAAWALRRLLGVEAGSEDAEVLAGVVRGAFDFDVPLRQITADVHLLELFHGPTMAFKDLGARFMARALAALDPGERSRTVLVATSGDTGGAVAHAFHGVEGAQVVCLFPRDGVSELQRRQMTTLGGNVTAVAVDGTFDDCQRMVRAALADRELVEASGLTSANSINPGRWIPQALYYVFAAARLGWGAWPATFVVPSGNLGNLSAGLLAHRAGMPSHGFVAATNRNRVFPDYLGTGRFESRASVSTPASAMDVGNPSNVERIRWLYDGDHAALTADVRGHWVDDQRIRGAMKDAYERAGVLLDPHTAVGWAALAGLSRPPGPAVLVATAHPAKFPDEVERATGVRPEAPPTAHSSKDGRERSIPLSADAAALKDLLRRRR